MKKENKDLYLPKKYILVCGLCWVISIICFVVAYFLEPFYWVLTVFFFALGAPLFLQWKNQWVLMINDDELTYSNMWGLKKKFRFSDCEEIRWRYDGEALIYIFKNGKMSVENDAIMSERLDEALAVAIDRYADEQESTEEA